MNLRLIYERPDGGISVLAPAPNARRMVRDPESGALVPESDEDFLQRLASEDVKVPLTAAAEIPSPDGKVAVAAGTLIRRRLAQRLGLQFAEPAVVTCTAEDIPADRTYRNAWCLQDVADGDRVTVTARVAVRMSRCRELHMARIRAARDTALTDLDVPQQRAMVAKDEAEVARIEGEKQALRDLPQTFDLTAAVTPDTLSALWPEGLAPIAELAQAAPKAGRRRAAVSGVSDQADR
jgi:hypothetical protein